MPILGGLFQSSVKDLRSGKIVEGDGGMRVLVAEQPVPEETGRPVKEDETRSGKDVRRSCRETLDCRSSF